MSEYGEIGKLIALKMRRFGLTVRVRLLAPNVPLAQWIEHRSSTPWVGSSNLSRDAKNKT